MQHSAADLVACCSTFESARPGCYASCASYWHRHRHPAKAATVTWSARPLCMTQFVN